jgi:hypothetical protein
MEAKLKAFNVIGYGLWVIGNGGEPMTNNL